MLTLAVEQSTATAGVALVDASRVLVEHGWQETRRSRQTLFTSLEAVLKDSGMTLARIDRFAVGLGPGAFSSLRMAVTAVQALARPGHKQVRGVSSSEALAVDVMQETGVGRVTVIGDARRQALWTVRFEATGSGARQVTPFQLTDRQGLRDLVDRDSAVVSPDVERIGDELCSLLPYQADLLKASRSPKASVVARLAAQGRGYTSEQQPLTPLYLHPPVFVNPRFPAA